MAKQPRKATTAENLQATLNNPNVRKFLDMLSTVEGTTTHGYNTTFGGGRIDSLESHPNIQREFKQTDRSTNSSGAAGRYQFLDKTWRTLQQQYPQQMPDFGERSQDFGAVALIAGRGALQDVVNGRFGTAVAKVGNIWASLPTSPYKQPKKSWDDVNKALGLQVPAGGAKAANAQALTPEQGKRLYNLYQAGQMSPEQRADYERDFATIQKPAGAKLLGGGSGGGGSAPKPAAVTQAAATPAAGAAPYVLPVEIIMAYNDGSMNPQQRADFERDYKAGVIAAPRHIPFKLQAPVVPVADRDYTGNRTQQFLDKTSEALGNAGRVIAGDGLIDAATALPRVALGGAQALVQGLGGLGVSAVSGLSGLGAGAQAALSGGNFAEAANNQIQYANRVLEPLIPQPVIAPKTTGALLEAMAVPMYATEAGGQANFDAYGNPLSAAAVQGLGDAGLAALGFRGVGKAPAPRPQPTPAPALPAATARPAPRAPAAPLATNPADLAAQAEAMPRPATPQPILSGSDKPFPVEAAAQSAIKYAKLQATHEVRPFQGGYAIFPKSDTAPRPNAAGRTELTAENPTITIQPDGTPARPAPAPVPDAITDAAPTNQPIRRPEGKAFTTSQKPVAFEYDVVPIESVVKSTNADLTPNTAARPELQPRNRDTDASTAQINTITNLLNPEWLAESPKFSDGAPTVFGSEAVAGHGRLAAIERRYAQGVGDEYRNFITQKAAELGIDPARLAGIERPVLVRRVKDEADALTIAQDSNAPTTLRMSPAEQARIDAPNLPDLDKLARGADGEMNIPASYDFVRDFMGKLPVAERGDLMTPDGRISQTAVRRIQAAVAEKAYKDPDLIARFTESMGDEGKRISAALQKQAGAVAALAEAAAKGERYPTTLGADLAQAANKYADIKAAGSTVREYLDQGQLVDDGLSVGAREALEVMGENAKSGRAIGEYIQGKIAEVEAKGNPMQDSLFQSSRAQKEAEAVRRQYEGTPQWMQAPDGTPTKLSEQQWVQVRTPSFKEWFGDWENNPKGASKVVDENGEPLVVYHGTDKTFSEFLKSQEKDAGDYGAGFYATPDKYLARGYAEKYAGSKDGAIVMPIYVNIKKPFNVNIDSNLTEAQQKFKPILDAAESSRFSESLIQQGYDGVTVTVRDIDPYSKAVDFEFFEEVVSFDPTQIKSATGNSGAFDSANPNIYMQANKPQAAAIGERIAAQVKAAGRSADEATQAGKLAEAYYAATAKALGLTPDEVFAQVGLSVERGNVGGANAALRLGEREHSMVFGENANASSFVHEAGHHFLETHAKLADQSPKLQADVDAVMAWAGHDGRAWSDLTASQKREVHEKFAESFEQYLLTGKAPTKGLKGVFENFKQWLTDVYTSLAEFAATNPRADLSPEVMAVMDRMLGGGKAEKAANAARGKNRKKSAPITPELLDFKRSAPVSGGVSPALHQSRYDVLRDIGLTDGQIRGGSVEGDLKRLEWDAELAKYDTEYGVRMKEQLELERQKLREYGDGVVESMGGTAKATPETRGAAIVRPLEAYQAWYRDKIKAFYKLADEQGAMTGGIELRGLEAKLKEDSAYHNEPLQGMRKSVRSFLFEQRLLDSRGNIKPMSAKQAETVRKHLNSIRTFETGSVISELNTLIDDAVFSTLNRSVYGEARAVNTQYHRIFSDPKGIATLLKVDGINRTISHEKVAANVAALAETDAAQFRHIMKQLESMPTPELQKMGNQAIGEIRAQIAEKITAYDSTKPDTVAAIGKALAPYRGAKLREIFGEKGAQKLETFVAAHGILRKVDAQPSGTASMLRNIATKGSEVGATMGGTAAGGALAGPAGAAAGAVIGQQIGAKIKGAIAQAVDKKSYGKAMSPRQLETMRQSYDASGRRLAALPETEAATAAAQAAPDSARARVTNGRLERSKEWIAFYSKLTDEQKAAVKKIGAAAWLLSVGGSGDNQASDDGENR